MMNRTDTQTLASLRRYRDNDGNAVVVCYGNKYIDRAPVLSGFLRDQRSVFYSAACVTDREQRRRFAAIFREKGTAIPEYPSWQELFACIRASAAAGGKLIVVLDRFEHFFYEDGGFFSALAAVLGTDDEAQGSLFFLLLSDDEVWVENTFVSKAGSSAAVVSGFVKRRESRFTELRKAFPKLSFAEATALYTVFGGETALWKLYDPAVSFKDNICRLFLTDGPGGISDLAMQRLSDLVREPAVYATILAGLASGREKLGDLYHATQIPRAKLSVYLKTLMGPRYVEKVFSFGTAANEQTKKGVYRISNPFMRFYFRVLYPNESLRRQMTPDKFFDMYLSSPLIKACTESFRDICREYMEDQDEKGALPFAIAEEGEWNGKAGSIDLIAESEEGESLIGLSVYDRILTEEDYHFLLGYARQAKIRPDHCYLFSAEGFGTELIQAAKHVIGLHLVGIRELEHG